jgi:hypothetical protein
MNKSAEVGFDHPLPAQLLEAPREFNAWSQRRLLVEQREATPNEPLYHYTGEEALQGIFRHQRLWCFSHLHQTDQQEFKYSLELARKVIREVGDSRDFYKRHFCACLDDILETNGLASPFDFYLFSLSRHRDDPGQWKNYGNQGRGFAIGFAPSLLQADKNELSERANENVHIGRVIYGDGPIIARHRLVMEKAATITSRFANRYPERLRFVRPVPYLAAMAREVIASQLIWNCLTAKESRYRDEREVRCIIMGIRKDFDAFRKNFGTRQYVETPMPLQKAGSIAEILIGPLAPPKAESRVTTFLQSEGYRQDIPVRRSSVTPSELSRV